MKLKYPNLYLQDYEQPSVIPEPSQLQYTMVLTKQSALFNAWKEMNRVASEYDIPFRCVTQWATHQNGKLYDTLGIKLESLNIDKQSAGVVLGSSVAEPCLTKPASAQKSAARGKKVSKKPKA